MKIPISVLLIVRISVFRIRFSNSFLKFEFSFFKITVRITELVTKTEIILEVSKSEIFIFVEGFISWLCDGGCEINICSTLRQTSRRTVDEYHNRFNILATDQP
jgi:hypothetical protein